MRVMRRGLGIFQFFGRPERVSVVVDDDDHIHAVIQRHIFDHIARTLDTADFDNARATGGSHIQGRRDPPSNFIRPDDRECGQ